MLRILTALLAGLMLLPAAIRAADGPPAGTGSYKLTILDQQRLTYWLIGLDAKDGKWTAKVLATVEDVPASTIEGLSVAGDGIRFTLKIAGGPAFGFEGKLPKEAGKNILGTISQDKQVFPAQLEPTTLKSLDSYELMKEIVATQGTDPKVFAAAHELLRQANAKKAKTEEVRGWADKAFKAAEAYGPRWQREMAVRTAEALANQEGLATVAVEYARRAERLLDAKDDAAAQMRVLSALAAALKKADKAEEAKEVQARVDKLEVTADQDYLKKMPPFKAEPFAGRKAKSDRVVLVELFTGAQCPPCVAADLAFDGLTKTYKPSDVVLLQYHLHIPGPDPLANPDSEARQGFYDKDVEGTPTILANGSQVAPGGGGIDNSAAKYKEYRSAIEPLLEKPAKAKLKALAVQKGNTLDISAEVADVEKPGETVRLRFALVEEQVRYLGSNSIRFHHHVVRALPGGAQGFALTDKTGKFTASVDLVDLRKKWDKYLDGVARQNPFPTSHRPLDFKKLSVVAFVQESKSKEVLQAVQVEVLPTASAEK